MYFHIFRTASKKRIFFVKHFLKRGTKYTGPLGEPEKNIVYLKADWTRKDPEIASILARYGRTGVPLYLLFPPVGAPTILPELLTESLLLDFLNEIN